MSNGDIAPVAASARRALVQTRRDAQDLPGARSADNDSCTDRLLCSPMVWRTLLIVSGLVASVGAASFVRAADHQPDGLVQFVNNSSNSVAVSVDGSPVCTVNPGTSCSTQLSGSDADAKHAVHADTSGRSWDDRVAISECHWNWAGTKTFTFTDTSVPFDCKNSSLSPNSVKRAIANGHDAIGNLS